MEFCLMIVMGICAISIVMALNAIHDSIRSINHKRFSICKYCGRPIYWARGSKIWWAYDKEVHVTERCTKKGIHKPVGVEE